MYLELLITLQKGTATRKAFDRSLQSLPITQHSNLWKVFLSWVKDFGVEDSAIRVYRRYLMFDEAQRENYVEYLTAIGQFDEAIKQLAICVNDEHYISPNGSTKHALWMKLCELCASNPESASISIKVDSVIRSGISRFSDEVGRLWCRLADFYTRLGQFEKARDIYEEGIGSVITVRDFTIVFDAYAKFEESVLTAKMQYIEDDQNDDEDESMGDGDEIQLRLARLEYLMDKRPLLLNSVVLRQNPHNVHEWLKRIKLFRGDNQKLVRTFAEAIKTVDPEKAVGRLSRVWLDFSHFYENQGDLENARAIFKRASKVSFRTIEELAQIWCSWGEFELKHENFSSALSVMQQAVKEPVYSQIYRKERAMAREKGNITDEGATIHQRLHKNLKVWNLYLDLEESLGSTESARCAYDKAMDLKVVTPQMVLNYATFLEENDYFEDSFRVYERGIALFTFPHVKNIWLQYLDKFISRYEGTKIERLRDLFDQAISKVPANDAAEFYILYAKSEEKYGLVRHAMTVYDKATRAVPETNRLDMYRLYVKKVEQHYGITKTRAVYERAIAELNDEMSRQLCEEFAEMERKLGEVDRARAIYAHGSQFADPRRQQAYWRSWREFEEAHGNEDTFKEMLRIKRSVEAAFAQVNYLALDAVASTTITPQQTSLANMTRGMITGGSQSDPMKEVEMKHRLLQDEKKDFGIAKKQRTENPEEIDIDI